MSTQIKLTCDGGTSTNGRCYREPKSAIRRYGRWVAVCGVHGAAAKRSQYEPDPVPLEGEPLEAIQERVTEENRLARQRAAKRSLEQAAQKVSRIERMQAEDLIVHRIVRADQPRTVDWTAEGPVEESVPSWYVQPVNPAWAPGTAEETKARILGTPRDYNAGSVKIDTADGYPLRIEMRASSVLTVDQAAALAEALLTAVREAKVQG